MKTYRIILLFILATSLYICYYSFKEGINNVVRGCCIQSELHDLKNKENEEIFYEKQKIVLSYNQSDTDSFCFVSGIAFINVLLCLLGFIIDFIVTIRNKKLLKN
jgi:hypothetical protein